MKSCPSRYSTLSSLSRHYSIPKPAEQLRLSRAKRYLDYLVFNERKKVEIFRKILIRNSGRELFKPFKGKIVRITGTTFNTDKDKVIRGNTLRFVLNRLFRGFWANRSLRPRRGGIAQQRLAYPLLHQNRRQWASQTHHRMKPHSS